ncbi:MAG: hypothetical protein U9P82_11875 [Bacteroidota bacterium]|nr:hypothetical protein [Bacteroidota bacterium]
MKHRFLTGFTVGFIIAFLGDIIIVSSDVRSFWARIILFLIGVAIFAILWFVRKRPEK